MQEQMDSSQDFPPPPREMYPRRHIQQVNGHNLVEAPETPHVQPFRTSSTLQVPSHHPRDLSPPPAVKSPYTLSPTGQLNNVSHESNNYPKFAFLDELAHVKLRAVNDTSPRPICKSPVSPLGINSGTASFSVRVTPSNCRNICEEDTTLPPPPPLDDLDELPPPPPPHELLFDPASLTFDNDTPSFYLQKPQPRIPTGEANSLQISHQHIHQQEVSLKSDGSSGAKHKGKFHSDLDRMISMANTDFEIPDDIDISKCPGLVEINKHTPNWKKDMIEKKNQEKIEEYVKAVKKEREQEAKWKNVPEWKKKILQKKDEEEGITGSVKSDTKPSSKKPAKKPPVPPPKEGKEDLASLKPKGDIVPAALSIDPEELAAMPPWKRELLFKRDKVPVTFSNEFNPEDGSTEGNETAFAS